MHAIGGAGAGRPRFFAGGTSPAPTGAVGAVVHGRPDVSCTLADPGAR